MKIAVITEDKSRVSSHFGKAPYFVVYSIEKGEIVDKETRDKASHLRHAEAKLQIEAQSPPNIEGEKPSLEHQQNHIRGHGNHGSRMLVAIQDCDVLICGGMGTPAYNGALSTGMEIILAGGIIEDTVSKYIQGDLQSDMRRVHEHKHK